MQPFPLIESNPELKGPQVFEQPKQTQFTYTERVPITPTYSFGVDPGLDWAALGDSLFKAGSSIFEAVTEYQQKKEQAKYAEQLQQFAISQKEEVEFTNNPEENRTRIAARLRTLREIARGNILEMDYTPEEVDQLLSGTRLSDIKSRNLRGDDFVLKYLSSLELEGIVTKNLLRQQERIQFGNAQVNGEQLLREARPDQSLHETVILYNKTIRNIADALTANGINNNVMSDSSINISQYSTEQQQQIIAARSLYTQLNEKKRGSFQSILQQEFNEIEKDSSRAAQEAYKGLADSLFPNLTIASKWFVPLDILRPARKAIDAFTDQIRQIETLEAQRKKQKELEAKYALPSFSYEKTRAADFASANEQWQLQVNKLRLTEDELIALNDEIAALPDSDFEKASSLNQKRIQLDTARTEMLEGLTTIPTGYLSKDQREIQENLVKAIEEKRQKTAEVNLEAILGRSVQEQVTDVSNKVNIFSAFKDQVLANKDSMTRANFMAMAKEAGLTELFGPLLEDYAKDFPETLGNFVANQIPRIALPAFDENIKKHLINRFNLIGSSSEYELEKTAANQIAGLLAGSKTTTASTSRGVATAAFNSNRATQNKVAAAVIMSGAPVTSETNDNALDSSREAFTNGEQTLVALAWLQAPLLTPDSLKKNQALLSQDSGRRLVVQMVLDNPSFLNANKLDVHIDAAKKVLAGLKPNSDNARAATDYIHDLILLKHLLPPPGSVEVGRLKTPETVLEQWNKAKTNYAYTVSKLKNMATLAKIPQDEVDKFTNVRDMMLAWAANETLDNMPVGSTTVEAVMEEYAAALGLDMWWDANQNDALSVMSLDVLTPIGIAMATAAPDATVDDIVNNSFLIAGHYGWTTAARRQGENITTVLTRDLLHSTDPGPVFSRGDKRDNAVGPVTSLISSLYPFQGNKPKPGYFTPDNLGVLRKTSSGSSFLFEDALKLVSDFSFTDGMTVERIKSDKVNTPVLEALFANQYDSPIVTAWVNRFNNPDITESRKVFIERIKLDGGLNGVTLAEWGLNIYQEDILNLPPAQQNALQVWRPLVSYTGTWDLDDPNSESVSKPAYKPVVDHEKGTVIGYLASPTDGALVNLRHPLLDKVGRTSILTPRNNAIYGPFSNNQLHGVDGSYVIRDYLILGLLDLSKIPLGAHPATLRSTAVDDAPWYETALRGIGSLPDGRANLRSRQDEFREEIIEDYKKGRRSLAEVYDLLFIYK